MSAMSAASAAAAAARRAMEIASGEPEPVQKSSFLQRVQTISSLAFDVLARAAHQVFSFFQRCATTTLSVLSTFGTQDPDYPLVKI